MTHEELMAFRKHISEPIDSKLFDKVELNDGMAFIDCLEVYYLDGRNCGHDCRMIASGLKMADGEVVPFEHEEFDVSLKKFLSELDYPFISQGHLLIEDEINPVEIKTKLCNATRCASIFNEFHCMEDKTYLGNSIEYEKMARIHGESFEETPTMTMNM